LTSDKINAMLVVIFNNNYTMPKEQKSFDSESITIIFNEELIGNEEALADHKRYKAKIRAGAARNLQDSDSPVILAENTKQKVGLVSKLLEKN